MSSSAILNSITIAATAFTINVANADSLVIVSLAGEAFDGPPKFSVMAGDQVIGSGTLANAIETEKDGRLFTKARPSMFLEQFSFKVPDERLLPNKEISIALTNDKFAEREGAGEDGILDRNLFVDFISVNGVEVTSVDLALLRNGEVQHLAYQAGLLPLYEGDYRVVAKPPTGGWAPAMVGASVVGTTPTPMPALASWTLHTLQQSAN